MHGPITEIDTGEHPAGAPLPPVTFPMPETATSFIGWLRGYLEDRLWRSGILHDGANLMLTLRRPEEHYRRGQSAPHRVDLFIDAFCTPGPRDVLEQQRQDSPSAGDPRPEGPSSDMQERAEALRYLLNSTQGPAGAVEVRSTELPGVVGFSMRPAGEGIQVTAQPRRLVQPFLVALLKDLKAISPKAAPAIDNWLGREGEKGQAPSQDEGQAAPEQIDAGNTPRPEESCVERLQFESPLGEVNGQVGRSRRGRPPGTGTWPDAEAFLSAIETVITELSKNRKKTTIENAAIYFRKSKDLPKCDERTLRRWVNDVFKVGPWPDLVKRTLSRHKVAPDISTG